jgi:hypothetical protein
VLAIAAHIPSAEIGSGYFQETHPDNLLAMTRVRNSGCTDAVVNRQELSIPPKVTVEMAKGFTLYMLQAVLNGRGDEIIELARTNLRR